MRVFSVVLMVLYVLIGLLWIANSAFLFSKWGIILWIALTLLGFISCKFMEKGDVVRTFIMYLALVMVFLLVITGIIHVTTASMP